ncbi:Predicted anti-sigma-YlaC factor YlaD, contains Zn-finger domain [Blastococcus sp. DSM 46786]|uniref:zf-HC2 domain-containing protein n=1 Tax=Blastococcus sp. DSM 46786 TaxID=1798227 RepID=UPI0008AC2B06|nr:zf-HC2 domain-containing protein [Blastococcus sp. DSM 46786]SEK82734.1 Predicted anti-sigma-YlaC factor YlaD, contains Zn-finger domain [Blastococcus sp. DSM 46786]
MPCHLCREALSSRLDGEPLGMPAEELDAHLAACADCAVWAAAAERVTRRARLAPAPAVPDLTATVLGALPRELPGARAAARARLTGSALRLALLVVGVAQATLAWPLLASGAGAMSAPVHMARESGAWNLALAAAFLAVAAGPRLAAGALPFLGSFVAFLLPVTVADLQAGHVHADRALTHLLLLAGTVLVSAVAWRGRRRAVPAVAGRRVPA